MGGIGRPPTGVHFCFLLVRQQQGVEVPEGPVRTKHLRPWRNRQCLRNPGGRERLLHFHCWHRQWLDSFLGLAQRSQVSELGVCPSARQYERGEWRVRNGTRSERLTASDGGVRQDGQDLP